jgi:anti-sigma factor RsiW
MACTEYEPRWEDYLEGHLDAIATDEVTAHLAGCRACQQALAAARLGEQLLRAGLEPVGEPSPSFWYGVVAGIGQAEEKKRQFWGALEGLAWRLSLSAAVAVALLSVYLGAFHFVEKSRERVQQTEIREIFPEPVQHPTTRDEMLLTLAVSEKGR